MTVPPKKDVGRAEDLETCPQPERIVTVLVVSPSEEDHLVLHNIFGHSNWNISGARTWEEARAHLAQHRTPVVIYERDVPDGEWSSALEALSEMQDPPLMIVTSRLADDFLWAEVLNLGGYDVLMKPFDPTEVFRVISLAWLNWKERRERRRRLQATSPRLAIATG